MGRAVFVVGTGCLRREYLGQDEGGGAVILMFGVIAAQMKGAAAGDILAVV